MVGAALGLGELVIRLSLVSLGTIKVYKYKIQRDFSYTENWVTKFAPMTVVPRLIFLKSEDIVKSLGCKCDVVQNNVRFQGL